MNSYLHFKLFSRLCITQRSPLRNSTQASTQKLFKRNQSVFKSAFQTDGQQTTLNTSTTKTILRIEDYQEDMAAVITNRWLMQFGRFQENFLSSSTGVWQATSHNSFVLAVNHQTSPVPKFYICYYRQISTPRAALPIKCRGKIPSTASFFYAILSLCFTNSFSSCKL